MRIFMHSWDARVAEWVRHTGVTSFSGPMALPFKLNPEPPKPPADDPFLEFDSERPGVRPKMPSHDPLLRPELPEVRSERLGLHMSEPTLGLGQPAAHLRDQSGVRLRAWRGGPRDRGGRLLPVVAGARDSRATTSQPQETTSSRRLAAPATVTTPAASTRAVGFTRAIARGGAARAPAHRPGPAGSMWRRIRPEPW